jgi:dienelactone hydrolase
MERYISDDLTHERNVTIPIPDSQLFVNGVLRGDYSQPLVVLAPGLGGWMHDLLLFNASRWLDQEGIATLRVSFYGDSDSQRNIGDFGVKENAADIDAVVNYARQQGTSWICVVGHSYSGMAIVYSKEQAFDAAVLWDASHTDGYDEPQSKHNLERDFVYIKSLDSYVSANGAGYVLSRKVFENYAPGSTAMAQHFKVPTLIVNAEDSGETMLRFGKNYARNILSETEYTVISGASHPFTENGAMEKLFSITTTWLKSQITK